MKGDETDRSSGDVGFGRSFFDLDVVVGFFESGAGEGGCLLFVMLMRWE